MQLKFIKEEQCPVCGCNVIIKESIETSSGRISEHVYGGNWEHRTFLCGQEIEYVPNFTRAELNKYNICTNNDEYKNNQLKKEKEKHKLIEYINSLDVDEQCKNNWKNSIY